jgi:hypothetical protein
MDGGQESGEPTETKIHWPKVTITVYIYIYIL